MKLKLRDKQMESSEDRSEDESIGVKVAVKELDDVLFRDVGNKIASDGRCADMHTLLHCSDFNNSFGWD